MPLFNVLKLIEFDESKDDIKLIIIYDENDDRYYSYGTRRRPSDNYLLKFIDFKICFRYECQNMLLKWIGLACNSFDVDSRFTYEFHQIELDESEYADNKLNYTNLSKKLSGKTEIFGYDKRSLTEGELMEKLDLLTGSTNL